MTNSLRLEKVLNSGDCIRLLAFYSPTLLESKHINYLIVKNEMPGSGIVQTLSCDLSGISWSALIERNLLDYNAMKVIVAQGGLFKSYDIQIMIPVCEDNMLEFTMDHCTPKPTNRDMCEFSEKALKYKKFGFIKVLISRGAKLNVASMVKELSKSDIFPETEFVSYIKLTVEGRVGLFLTALKYSEYEFAESFVNDTESESVASQISLSSVLECPIQGNLEARKRYVSFVKRLLENGIDPNGNEEANSLNLILNLPKANQTEKIELLTLLLQQGAMIERCTYQTTLPHIATKLAIEAGKSKL